MAWREADLKTVIQKSLRLEVKFRNANIYSFTMNHHFLDVADHRLLQDGKPINTPPLFIELKRVVIAHRIQWMI